MRKNLLFTLLLSCSGLLAQANDLSLQLVQLNNSSVQAENDLWQRMRDGFRLNHDETKEVKYWEKRYGSPKYFNIIMQNASPYLYFMITEMERRGMPTELALIPIVESTYNPNAVSPAAISTGMWQFIASSGNRFGLVQNADLDERKDIIKSSRAAISYLQYLHDMFGSWELAIAAYNWGEGNINNAVVGSGSRNFYELDVRDVTHQYVPKVIALANIIQNPGKFGIKLTNLENKPYFAIAHPQAPLKVSDFMSMANLSAAENKKLNPQFRSTDYTVQTNQRLLLPVSNQPAYLASLGSADPNFAANKQPIATALGYAALAKTASNLPPVSAASATDSLDNNGLVRDRSANDELMQLASQEELKAPAASSIAASDPAATNAALTTNSSLGDSISITSNNSSPQASANPQSLAAGQTNDTLSPDEILTAAAGDMPAATTTNPSTTNPSAASLPTAAPVSGSKFVSYTVVSGDTLYSIAKKFAVPIDSIRVDNQMGDNTVKLNQTLLIRSNSSNS